MKISTKGRYALRIMLDIAVMGEAEPVRVKDIAKRQDISVKYMEQIIIILTRAGYLKSNRGPQGGYRLTRQPKDYTVGMILRLTEGSLAPVSCLDEDINLCSRQEYCATLGLWKELNDAIKGVIDRYTLQDLVDKQKEMSENYII